MHLRTISQWIAAFSLFALPSASFALTSSDFTRLSGATANEKLGRAVASGDFNKDGIDDIFMAAGVSNLLLKGNSDGTFTNVSKEAGIDVSRGGKGVTFADYDNDGNPDIFVVGFEMPNILYRNNGNGIVALSDPIVICQMKPHAKFIIRQAKTNAI